MISTTVVRECFQTVPNAKLTQHLLQITHPVKQFELYNQSRSLFDFYFHFSLLSFRFVLWLLIVKKFKFAVCFNRVGFFLFLHLFPSSKFIWKSFNLSVIFWYVSLVQASVMCVYSLNIGHNLGVFSVLLLFDLFCKQSSMMLHY